MAGYDKCRLVGLKDKYLDHYTCGICHNILNDPVVVRCCQQTYCKLCINEWITRDNTCPNDRQILDGSDLSPAPTLVRNILNGMRIKCERHVKGCPTVVTIGELKAHIDSCPHFKCFNCGAKDPDVDHSCVEHLLKIVDHLKGKLNGNQDHFGFKGNQVWQKSSLMARFSAVFIFACLLTFIFWYTNAVESTIGKSEDSTRSPTGIRYGSTYTSDSEDIDTCIEMRLNSKTEFLNTLTLVNMTSS